MAHEPVFRVKARKDIAETFAWYESKRSGLGDQFLLELQRSVGGILLNPERYPRIHRLFRQAPVHRFPYVVIYRPLAKIVVIMRVFHTKQDPGRKLG